MIKRNKTITKVIALTACISMISCTSIFAAEIPASTTDESVSINAENTVQDGYYTFDSSTGEILSYYDNSNRWRISSSECYLGFSAETGTITSVNVGSKDRGALVLPNDINGAVITNIGFNAFSNENCTNFNKVVLPDTLTSIGDSAFLNCSNLREIKIPESVTEIGPFAFGYCKYLNNIELNDNLESIGRKAFYKCTCLSNVSIPDSVTSIGECAFEDCTSLSTLSMSDNVTSIDKQAFLNCYNLRELTLSKSLTKLDLSIFDGCKGLSSITIPGDIEEIYYNSYSLFGFDLDAVFNVSTSETKEKLIKCGVKEANINLL